MPNTLTVQTWDLVLPRPSWVLVTNPDRQLPCHFSKTVLRIPSIRKVLLFFVRKYVIMKLPLKSHGLFLTVMIKTRKNDRLTLYICAVIFS